MRDPPKGEEEEEEDDEEYAGSTDDEIGRTSPPFTEHRLPSPLATTNTEDSHTSLSSSTRRPAKKGSHSTTRWLTSTGGGGQTLQTTSGLTVQTKQGEFDFLSRRFAYDPGRSHLLSTTTTRLGECPSRQMQVMRTSAHLPGHEPSVWSFRCFALFLIVNSNVVHRHIHLLFL